MLDIGEAKAVWDAGVWEAMCIEEVGRNTRSVVGWMFS